MGTPAQPYFPQIDKSVDPKVTRHLELIYTGINDHDAAIVALKSQLNAAITVASKTTVINNTTSSSSTTTFSFPGLGQVNNQTGNTSYTVQTQDNGIMLIVDDVSPIAISLNSVVTKPYLFFITNFGAGTATLTPTTGTINGSASFAVPQNYLSMVVFDGTNWWASVLLVLPQNTPAVTHEWLNSYNSATGAFTQTQPAFTDISGVAAPSQIPTPTATTIGGVESIGPVAHEWINEIDTSGVPHLSQPAYTDISGTPPPILSGTTGSMGGTAMTVGQTITATATVTGATSSMLAMCSPQSYPGDGFDWDCYVSAANTVTARLTCVLAGTPTASVYNVRCIQ